MVSPQIILLAAFALGGGALICLIRLHTLQLSPVYPALTSFFLAQIVITFASYLIGARTKQYEWLYLALLTLEWSVYGFLIREIYSSIFTEFPGIAILGRWSLYFAFLVTALVVVVSTVAGSQLPRGKQVILFYLEMAAHCLTFGFAFLLMTIMVAISRYPIRLHKNVLVNTLSFGAVLIGEAAGLIVDQFTGRCYTDWINLAVSIIGTFCLLLWGTLLTREGQTQVLRLRRGVSDGEDLRLLDQLGVINSILLRAVRR